MKRFLVLLLGLVLAGCDFTVPLVTQPETAVDSSLVGLWERRQADGTPERLLVLPLGPKEYLVAFPADTTNALYARVCLTRVDDRPMAQLQWFGTARGELPDDSRVYQFARYARSGERLTVNLLNSEVISRDISSSKALVEAITRHRSHPELFREDLVFRRLDSTPGH